MPVTATEVGAIIRVSTKRQAEESDSPANQRHVLNAQGATRFYEYVGSGFSVEKRRSSPAWQELIQDIRDGRLHRLLATDISRAARKDELLSELIQLCDEHDVEFLAAGFHVTHGTAMSWYSAKQMGLMAELYSRDLSDRIKRGQAAAVARGVPAFTSKHLPWHLMREPGTRHGVIQHPERWDDAREAVMDYIEGRARLDALSARIHAKHGLMSSASSIHNWLRSHALLGHYGKRDGTVLITNCFPALITPEEGDLLRRRLVANRKRWGTTASHTVYPLTGLCRCVHCGHAMAHTTVKKADAVSYRYLRCASRRNCPAFRKLVCAELVERSILFQLGKTWEEMATKAATSSDQVGEAPEVVKLRLRVRKLEALLSEVDSPGVRADLKEANQRLQALEEAASNRKPKRVDKLKASWLNSDTGFMQRAHGERNADLLSVIDHCLVDASYIPEGFGWERRTVQHIAFR